MNPYYTLFVSLTAVLCRLCWVGILAEKYNGCAAFAYWNAEQAGCHVI